MKKALIIRAEGDSMEPSLRSGDVMLVDMRRKKAAGHKIYVIRRDGELLAKRLQVQHDRSVLIISDNKVWETEVIPPSDSDTIDIVGEVVWVCRRL